MKMNEFVTWLCEADDSGHEITAAQARKIWKRLSQELFKSGAQVWHVNERKGGENFIAHPMLMSMYVNGKRLKKAKRK